MLEFLLNLLIFLVVLSLVICIHEFGHLIFAKKAGILCHEFSFGMGPKVWARKRGETTYMIKAVPFGGYVAMAGEEVEADVLKKGQKIRIGLDMDGEITKIVLNNNNLSYQDFPEITVEDYDLLGKDGGKLFINEYFVKRNALYVYERKVMQIAPFDRTFNAKTKWQRFMVAFAGPMMNFVLAIFVFLLMYLVSGVADPSSVVISKVDEDAPAYDILKDGDEIVAINGVDVFSWSEDNGQPSVVSELAKYEDYSYFVFTVIRNGEEITLDPIYPQYYFISLNIMNVPGNAALEIFIPEDNESSTDLRTGDIITAIDGQTMTTWLDIINFQQTYTEGTLDSAPTVITYLRNGVEHTYSFASYSEYELSSLGYPLFASKIGITGSSVFNLLGIFEGTLASFVSASTKIFSTLGLLFTSPRISVSDLTGFVGIYSITTSARESGFVSLLSWIGFLSVNLGIVNLLPIPALDGGRIVFIGYEAIARRKPNQKFENTLNTVMFFLLIALLIFVTYNDILRLIG
ncbi:MAG TPA: RIP metalloprotease RseP [Bacillota bacterium]|nr:RIP metalloprotease RseP [Bacillota bacterium]HRX91896.1 RIP metalloprotease RseP [Candidatus Izemoplasmatales bacterium]